MTERTLNQLAQAAHSNAKGKGFYADDLDILAQLPPRLREKARINMFLARIDMIHAEAGELTEAVRKDPNAPCPKDPSITAAEEELADIIVRTLDLCGWMGIDIGRAVDVKMQYNEGRARMHGKKA